MKRGPAIPAALIAAVAASVSAQQMKAPLKGIGDGGPAIKAQLNAPSEIALDENENLYVYEQIGLVIRKIDHTTGRISTEARACEPWTTHSPPEGCFGPLGIGGFHIDPAGKLLLSEFLYNRLGLLDPQTLGHSVVAGTGAMQSSGDGRLATGAGISVSHCAVSDLNGNIFVCDSGYYIRRIESRTGIISTIAGTGKRGFSGDGGSALAAEIAMPLSVAVDQGGSVYISEDTINRIRRVDATTGIIQTIAGSGPITEGSLDYVEFSGEGGPATKARLMQPRSLTFDPTGNLVFVTNGRVCRIDRVTSILSTVAGTGKPGFSGDGGDAKRARIEPSGIAINRKGDIFIGEFGNNRVRRVDTQSEIITTVAGNGLPHRPPTAIF
jgi:DNA-binding beta-propeller fold protein YncE